MIITIGIVLCFLWVYYIWNNGENGVVTSIFSSIIIILSILSITIEKRQDK